MPENTIARIKEFFQMLAAVAAVLVPVAYFGVGYLVGQEVEKRTAKWDRGIEFLVQQKRQEILDENMARCLKSRPEWRCERERAHQIAVWNYQDCLEEKQPDEGERVALCGVAPRLEDWDG